MDQAKIGRFISERRRAAGLTQMQLAEKLNITDRAVSKWETGRAMPDTSIMLDLCRILKITVDDLLSGEVISMENYKEQSEKLLIDLAKQKEDADRQLLTLEILIGTFAVIILLVFTFAASFFEMPNWGRILCIAAGLLIGLTGIAFALRIEQTAGYYRCARCGHKYVPTYGSVLWAMHVNRTRYMKCPECGRRSWQKKVMTKE